MIQTFEAARALRRQERQSWQRVLPPFLLCCTPRLSISAVSLTLMVLSMAALGMLLPALAGQSCPHGSGDWLPGYDPFIAAFAVCACIAITAILGFVAVCATAVHALIAFGVLELPSFSCLLASAGMLLLYQEHSAALLRSYHDCAPTTPLRAFFAFAGSHGRLCGWLCLLGAAALAWTFAEVSRVIGFMCFLLRFMLVVNVFSALAGLGVTSGGVLLLTRSSQHAGVAAARQHVPGWFPPLMLLAGAATLLLSLLAHVGIARRREGALLAHALLSLVCVAGVVVLAAWPHSHFSDLKHIAAAHRLSVGCVAVLVCTLLLVNFGGTVHVLLRIRREGLSFQQLVLSAEEEMVGKLRSQRRPAAADAMRSAGARGPGREAGALQPAELSRPASGGDMGPHRFSIELEDMRPDRYHATVSSSDFFAPGGAGSYSPPRRR